MPPDTTRREFLGLAVGGVVFGMQGATLALSKTRFETGAQTGAHLASFLPPGTDWRGELLADFGGRVRLVGHELRAASSLTEEAEGILEARFASPDGSRRIDGRFVVAVRENRPSAQPSVIVLTPLNGQAVDGQSVESWRGREVLLASADAADCRIEVVDGEYRAQGSLGMPHVVSVMSLAMGDVGARRRLILRATNAHGSFEQAFEMETKPFRPSVERFVAFFDYTDPETVTSDANGRVVSVRDRLHGCLRIAPPVEGVDHSAVFDAARGRMRLDGGSFLAMGAGSENERWRSLLATEKHRLSHIVFFAASDFDGPRPLVTYTRGGDLVLGLRVNEQGGVEARRSGGGLMSRIKRESLFSRDATPADLVAGSPSCIAFVSNGVRCWGLAGNNVTQRTRNDVGNLATTFDDCELGRDGEDYFSGEILGEVIARDDICASELRGLYDTMKARWGLPDRREPEAFDFAHLENKPFYDSGDAGIAINPDPETDLLHPSGWVPQIAGRANRVGVPASNATENAYHVDPRYPGVEKIGTTDLSADGKRFLRFQPIDAVELPPAVRSYIGNLGDRYRFVGSALSTRRSVAPGPSHGLELVLRNPPAIAGNFACFGWTLAESGGHPPEIDWNEQSGPSNEISQGLHMAPRWPLMGTRLATGGTGFGMARSHTDREPHSYQFLIDAATDTIRYYQDGYLFSVQKPQRGLRLSSVRAFRQALREGKGAGTGIVADNGLATGSLKVLLASKVLDRRQAGRGARFTLKIVGGSAVDLYWDGQKDETGEARKFVPGSYEKSQDDVPFELLRDEGGAIVCDTPPDIGLLQVGMEDPVVPEDFHTAMYLILNNAAGGFTGKPLPDQVSEGFVSRVTYWHVRRPPITPSPGADARARSHCDGLFEAMGRSGMAPDDRDRVMIFDIVAGAMATDLMWGRPMDGADPIMDYERHRTLWDSIGMLGLFVGASGGMVDWIDPRNVFRAEGEARRSADLGLRFDGRPGSGRIDTMKSLSALAQVAVPASGLTILLTGTVERPGSPKRPLIGAGPAYEWQIGGASLKRQQRMDNGASPGVIRVPDGFSVRLGTETEVQTDGARMPMGPGLYSAVRRESRVNIWRNGDRSVPFHSGLIPGRDYATGHSPGSLPRVSLKIGSSEGTPLGVAASIGGFCVHRWWNDEEHARFVRLLAPLLRRYSVPIEL